MKHWRIVGILVVMMIGIALLSGCVNQPTDQPNVQNTTPTVVAPVVTIPMAISNATQTYKTANVSIVLNTKPRTPAFGFKMDYPSNWSFVKEDPYDWSAEYNFTSPDGESQVYVNIANDAVSSAHLDPLDIWATETINGLTQPYCHDGAGNRRACSPTEPGNAYHRLVLINNSHVTIPGSFDARKLAFTSNDDMTYGSKTVYLMHAGKMKGYNFTAPYHYETAVKVDGPAWDYGMGGLRYMVTLYTPREQVNATSGIFSHMINSFKIIK
ncbi:MAG: hypothetical protein NTZ39_01140 [Methanoregula sp.]|nr:hypothetical protein [Methanoregula sp.]